ncbi:hypothetical protein MHYP_G00347870 [Metynnis hypsauchen]
MFGGGGDAALAFLTSSRRLQNRREKNAVEEPQHTDRITEELSQDVTRPVLQVWGSFLALPDLHCPAALTPLLSGGKMNVHLQSAELFTEQSELEQPSASTRSKNELNLDRPDTLHQ